MAMRRQAYEWRALVPGAGSTARYETTGQITMLAAGGTIPSIPTNIYFDIMVGGLGNNIEIPGELRAAQFIVIDHIASWPPGSVAQLRIETTDYFASPDGGDVDGLPALASPFPIPNADNILTMPSLMGGLDPTVYVLPGQPWGIKWALVDDYYQATNYATATSVSTRAQNRLVPRCFVRYLLLDGADALIAVDLLKDSIPVTADNIQWYKRALIRQKLIADTSGVYDTALEKIPQKLG